MHDISNSVVLSQPTIESESSEEGDLGTLDNDVGEMNGWFEYSLDLMDRIYWI